MAIPLLLALIGVLIAGVLLILLGLRGKRLNDHPVCRQCRFDLQGAYPGVVTCPECGAGLKRDNSVRLGARRRRWVCFSTGLFITLFPLLAFAAIAFGLAAGRDLNAYKPMGLLLWEARHSSPTTSQAIAKQLLTRENNNKLANDQITRIALAAIDLQADPARPWCDEWGDLIENAHNKDLIDKDAYARFMRQTIIFDCTSRPKVGPTDPIPLMLKVKELRIGASSQLMAMIHFDQASIAGQPLRPTITVGGQLRSLSGFLEIPNRQIGWVQMYGKASGWGMTTNQTCPIVLEPADGAALTPGRHQASLSVAIEVHPISASNPIQWGAKPDAKFPRRQHTANVEVIPDEMAAIQRIAATDDLTRQLKTDLSPLTLMVYSQNASNLMGQVTYVSGSLTFTIAKPAVPLVFDVVLRSGDREWPMGSFSSGTLCSRDQNQFNFGAADDLQRAVGAQLTDFNEDKVDIVLRPNADLARHTLDITSLYDGEIVFPDAQVQWQGDRPDGKTSPQRRRGFFERLLFGS